MFRRPTIRYGQTPEPTTPYQRAAQQWDDRIGSARVQAKNWRLAFFGALALSGGLSAGLVCTSFVPIAKKPPIPSAKINAEHMIRPNPLRLRMRHL